jgi:GT2 family glycosyltransferase
MDVSVVVVNHNGKGLLLRCLESLPAGVETIVVDNGSKDGSPDEIAAKVPSAVVIRNRANLGFARAANQGLAAAKGKVLCLLHHDARLLPGALEKLPPDTALAARDGCIVARRELVDRIGPLDEAFFLTGEIEDWRLRARKAGFRVGDLPEGVVEHGGGGEKSVRFRIERLRDRFALARKHFPAAHLLLRVVGPLVSLANFLVCTVLIFVRGIPRRWVENAAAFAWQVAGCPRRWGLSAGAVPRYLLLRDGWRVTEERLEGFGDFDRYLAKAQVVKDYKYKKTLACTVAERSYLVKVYKQVGWIRRIKSAVFGSRAQHELRMCQGILERGIPTAPVVAVGERDQGSCVVFERLADWVQLQEALLSPETSPRIRRRLAFDYGRFARRVLDLGVWQFDFNPTNVLVKDGSFKLIDFERMKLGPRPVGASERTYLLAKMNRIAGVTRTDRWRFLRGFLQASAEETGRRKEIARGILRRGERQRDADLDRGGDRSVEENRDYGPFEAGEVSGFYRKTRPGWEGIGIDLDAVVGIARAGKAEGVFRLEPVENALARWREANRRAKDDRSMPLAVLQRKGESNGSLLYRNC